MRPVQFIIHYHLNVFARQFRNEFTPFFVNVIYYIDAKKKCAKSKCDISMIGILINHYTIIRDFCFKHSFSIYN